MRGEKGAAETTKDQGKGSEDARGRRKQAVVPGGG